jgi:hypothetical protein
MRAGAPDQVTLDVVASLVEIHSENKERAAAHFRRGYGFHPMFCVLDDGDRGEPLAGVLRAGNAAANSGADQLTVVDMALAQLPESHRRGHRPGDDRGEVAHPVLVRADSAGAVRAFIDGLIARNCECSITARTSDTLDQPIMAVPADAWEPARRVARDARRRRAQVAELDVTLAGWPADTRATWPPAQPFS